MVLYLFFALHSRSIPGDIYTFYAPHTHTHPYVHATLTREYPTLTPTLTYTQPFLTYGLKANNLAVMVGFPCG